MNAALIVDFLTRYGSTILWSLVLVVSLPLLYLFGLRQTERRATAILLGGLVTVLTVGQFAYFTLFALPGVQKEAGREIRFLREKLAIIDLDNVNQNELAIAYQRENAALNKMLNKLRAENDHLEAEVSGLRRKNRDRTSDSAGRTVSTARTQDAGRAASTSLSKTARTAGEQTGRSLSTTSEYRVTVLTAARNLALSRSIEAALRKHGFQIESAIPIEAEQNRLVYYAESDTGRAEKIAYILKTDYHINLQMKLSPNTSRRHSFQIFLKP